ncbi:hypothetical protein EVAR_95167_1 [Eumeta japonica]|uniref:Uncharacterized protein n=1 Tax=Eumeta variegata TaxID=151549 RepID=A0A4C1VI40_EUMVA|nr:hypothetical protein EVAR_95167_1 [Eumeta japonica]
MPIVPTTVDPRLASFDNTTPSPRANCNQYMAPYACSNFGSAEQIKMRLSMERRKAYWDRIRVFFISVIFRVPAYKSPQKWDS